MTYAALTEIILHLNEFKVHDEHSEGFYRLRVSCYYEKPVQYQEMDGSMQDSVELRVKQFEEEIFRHSILTTREP